MPDSELHWIKDLLDAPRNKSRGNTTADFAFNLLFYRKMYILTDRPFQSRDSLFVELEVHELC